MKKYRSLPRLLSMLVSLSILVSLSACGNGNDSETQPDTSQTTSTATTSVPTPTASPTPAVSPTPTSVTFTLTPSPSPTPTTTTPATSVSEIKEYELVAEMDYAFNGLRDPDQAGPQRVIDNFVGYFSQIAQDESMVTCQYDIGSIMASFLFNGPNGPDIQDAGSVTTSSMYTWNHPTTLTGGTSVELEATGIRTVHVLPGESMPEQMERTSGELYFSLFGSQEITMEVDFTGTGDGLYLIDPAFGTALDPLDPNENAATGTYSLSIPDGQYQTLALEVMYTPYNPHYSIHRIYIYQVIS